jgi:hypothetical protein
MCARESAPTQGAADFATSPAASSAHNLRVAICNSRSVGKPRRGWGVSDDLWRVGTPALVDAPDFFEEW